MPRVSDVLTRTARGKACAHVVRENPDGGERVETAVAGYVLCRAGAIPDYKQEIGGRRVFLNGYQSKIDTRPAGGGGGADASEEALSALWEAVLLTVVGEAADPGETVLAAWLACHSHTSRQQFTLDLWFAVREDKVCEAVCEELREVAAGLGAGVPRLGAFTKVEYFVKKHLYSKPGDYAGTPMGGVFDGVPDEAPEGAAGGGAGAGEAGAPAAEDKGAAGAGRGGRGGRGGGAGRGGRGGGR